MTFFADVTSKISRSDGSVIWSSRFVQVPFGSHGGMTYSSHTEFTTRPGDVFPDLEGSCASQNLPSAGYGNLSIVQETIEIIKSAKSKGLKIVEITHYKCMEGILVLDSGLFEASLLNPDLGIASALVEYKSMTYDINVVIKLVGFQEDGKDRSLETKSRASMQSMKTWLEASRLL